MEIDIPEDNLTGFNDKAREMLSTATSEFVEDLIQEANRLESSKNFTGDDPQITSNMVNDARVLIRRGVHQPKKSKGSKFLRVASAVLSLGVGIIYDSTLLQEALYMLIFIVVLTAAIITVTLSVFGEQ